jgi:tRNA(Ile)-lysidine synthase
LTHSFSKYFIEKASEECKKNGLLDVDTLIVGVSGGPDSMALLSFLSKVYPLERIFVVHVNHNIRPIDCDRDEKLVVDFCKSINVSCKVFSFDCEKEARDQGCSTELAGRNYRYRVFDEYAREIAGEDYIQKTRIAVAHHRGDLAETMMMNLFRGSGLDGLVSLSRETPRIIRPFLFFSKKEILTYLEENSIEFSQDCTNDMAICTRNVWRNEIFPMIDKTNGKNSIDALYQTYEFLQEDASYLNQVAFTEFSKHKLELDGLKLLPVSVVNDFSPSISKRMLRTLWLTSFGDMIDLSSKNIYDIVSICKKSVYKPTRICLPFNRIGFVFDSYVGFCEEIELEDCACLFARGQGFITVSSNMQVKLDLTKSNTIKIPRSDITIEIQIIENDKGIEYNDLSWILPIYEGDDEMILNLRNRFSDGQYSFCKAGSSSSNKIGKLFINKKVPKEARDNILFFCSNDEVLWMPGLGHACGYVDDISRERNIEDRAKYKRRVVRTMKISILHTVGR